MKILYVYVPGLGGEDILNQQRNIIKNWRSKYKNRDVLFIESSWNSNETYQDKINRILKTFMLKAQNYQNICIVGTSAGGSLGLNLFDRIKNEFNACFISIAGKITGSDAIGASYSKPHPALIPSVKDSEVITRNMSKQTAKSVYVIKPLIDFVVLRKYMTIKGAKNTTIPIIGHSLSIFMMIKYFNQSLFNNAEMMLK